MGQIKEKLLPKPLGMKMLTLGAALELLLLIGFPITTFILFFKMNHSSWSCAELTYYFCSFNYIFIVLPIVEIVAIVLAGELLKRLGMMHPYKIVIRNFLFVLFVFGLAASSVSSFSQLSISIVLIITIVAGFLGFYIIYQLSYGLHKIRVPKGIYTAIVLIFIGANFLAAQGISLQSYWAIDHNAFQFYAPFGYKNVNIYQFQAEGPNQNYLIPNYSHGFDMSLDNYISAVIYEYPAKSGINPKANCFTSPLDQIVALANPSDPHVCSIYQQINGVTIYQAVGSGTIYSSELFEIRGQTVIEGEIESGSGTTSQLASLLAAFRPVTALEFYSMYNSRK